MSSAFVDNSPKKKLERMAYTITRIKNELAEEEKKDKKEKDSNKIFKLKGRLAATISNFEELFHKEDMIKRLKKLGGRSRKGKKHTFKKNTRRNRRVRIRKTNKH